MLDWLLTYAAHSTLLLVGAWLLSIRLRSHAVRETLWKTALFGAFLTATAQVVLGVTPLLGRVVLGAPAGGRDGVAPIRGVSAPATGAVALEQASTPDRAAGPAGLTAPGPSAPRPPPPGRPPRRGTLGPDPAGAGPRRPRLAGRGRGAARGLSPPPRAPRQTPREPPPGHDPSPRRAAADALPGSGDHPADPPHRFAPAGQSGGARLERDRGARGGAHRARRRAAAGDAGARAGPPRAARPGVAGPRGAGGTDRLLPAAPPAGPAPHPGERGVSRRRVGGAADRIRGEPRHLPRQGRRVD